MTNRPPTVVRQKLSDVVRMLQLQVAEAFQIARPDKVLDQLGVY